MLNILAFNIWHNNFSLNLLGLDFQQNNNKGPFQMFHRAIRITDSFNPNPASKIKAILFTPNFVCIRSKIVYLLKHKYKPTNVCFDKFVGNPTDCQIFHM